MSRKFLCAVLVGAFAVGSIAAADKKDAKDPPAGKAVKAQMVKGTIKFVDPAKALLIVNQKLTTKDGKTQIVDRELSIESTTEFVINGDEYVGKGALEELVGKEGASVQIKCDKDVKVLKVTVKGKGKK
jgi:hypothetical protein